MRNYKKVSDCPLRLQQIIDAVNKLPSHIEEIQEGFRYLLDDDLDGKLNSEQIKKQVKSLIKQKTVFNYLLLGMSDNFSFSIIYQNFYDLIAADEILDIIASTNSAMMKTCGEEVNSKKELSVVVQKFLAGSIEIEVDVSGTMYVDKKGYIRPRNSGLVGVFSDHDIPFNRIRTCPNCNEFFWAKRLDAKSCGKSRCSDILSQRKLRSKRRGEINEQRRENYKRKKEIKVIKEKNGTL